LKEGWKGVRPVRFKEEIYGFLQLVVGRNEGVPVEEIRNHMLKLRLERENRRLKALQKSISLANSKRKRPELLTKVEQMIRVLRKTGLILKDGAVIRPTPSCRELISIKKRDEIGADAFFLERLLNSSFGTYWLFLRRLFESDQVLIPASFSERNKKLANHLASEGFPLDVWSFFILRDLFYDFALLNYVIDESFQKIFPLYDIEPEISESSHRYEYKIRGPDAYLCFWPKVSKDFVKQIVDVYLSLTDNKWNRMVDLITLREKYSNKYCVPEQQFDILLQRALKEESQYKMFLSVGYIDFSSRSTYITKALSLPHNEFGLPYSMMRIGVGY